MAEPHSRATDVPATATTDSREGGLSRPPDDPHASIGIAPVDDTALRLGDPLIECIIRKRFFGRRDFEHLQVACGAASTGEEPVDFLFLTQRDPHNPEEVFDRLRWGGLVILVGTDRKRVQVAARQYESWRSDQSDHAAWAVEVPLASQRRSDRGLLGWFSSAHYMVARKVMLVPPGKTSDRFTYHVHLEKRAGGYDVVKQIPSVERVQARLREKFPDADEESLHRRARKFTEKIFPVFLTRETAMLKLMQRDIPPGFRERIPRVISAETDAAGFTRTLRMTWLRNACPIVSGWKGRGAPLSQLEFARQAAELLTALHNDAGVMHLDLRLDNVVITEHGVGFVDFGSAVRVGEHFAEESLLSSLFDEMMRTSQIQRMLGRMTESGMVTSEEITASHQRIDKAVDFFYLALQINNPLSNPDFRGLVEYDPQSPEARALEELTDKILRPADPRNPEFTSAQDILHGIEEIAHRLHRPRGA